MFSFDIENKILCCSKSACQIKNFCEILYMYSLLAVYKNWYFAIYLQNNKTNLFGVWCILNGYLIHN